jgi:FtsH-binding integral membrane protein
MQKQVFHPEVQNRLRTTMGYFGGAVAGTGVFMQLFRNSSLAYMNPFIYMALSMGMLIGLHTVDYNTNFVLKNAMFAGWVGLVSTSLVPLIHMYSMPILFDAMLATGVTVGSLGAVAYNAPSQQFLNMGGVLAIGLGGLLGVSILSMFNPMSPALYNIWLYGGLGLFSLFVLYDTQMILNRAKTQQHFDPITNSIGIYLDAINIFIRFAMIFGNAKKK